MVVVAVEVAGHSRMQRHIALMRDNQCTEAAAAAAAERPAGHRQHSTGLQAADRTNLRAGKAALLVVPRLVRRTPCCMPAAAARIHLRCSLSSLPAAEGPDMHLRYKGSSAPMYHIPNYYWE